MSQFLSLSAREQDDWLAWDAQRRERLDEELQGAIDRASKDGKVMAESLTAGLLLLLVREWGG